MKKSIITFVIIGLVFGLFYRDSFAETKWQCGNRIISLGERYKNVLSKCGDPDDSYFYENELGLRLGTRLGYSQKKLVTVTFSNEFLDTIQKTFYEDSPVYLYFDRWGICIKIQQGDKP
jgi:hypothetical protein